MSNPAPSPGFPLVSDVRPEPPARSGNRGPVKLILAVVAAVVLVAAVFVLRSALFGGDAAQDAKAGDCIASDKDVKTEGTTETGANIVDCGSADARFTVVARVDGEGSTRSKACDKFFKAEEVFYVFANSAGDGYVLCLRPTA